MKFQLVSDLHLDFFRKEQINFLPMQIFEYAEAEQPDALIIAGDLAEIRDPVWSSAMSFFADHYSTILYVLGNHEHYFSDRTQVQRALDQLPSHVHVLENRTMELGGLRICGSSLWFPKRNCKAKHMLNDFNVIPSFEDWVYDYHQDALNCIANSNADLVITHHAPHTGSISLQYIGHELNPFFVVDCTDLIKTLKPFVWVHGHCHSASDYVVDQTRILSNPFGYPREYFQRVNQYPPLFFDLQPAL
jgi:Icc-related predicted phosphoesterase